MKEHQDAAKKTKQKTRHVISFPICGKMHHGNCMATPGIGLIGSDGIERESDINSKCERFVTFTVFGVYSWFVVSLSFLFVCFVHKNNGATTTYNTHLKIRK